MTEQELLTIARKLLRSELTEALDRLKPEHQDSLIVQIAAKPLLEWVTQLDAAEADLEAENARLREALSLTFMHLVEHVERWDDELLACKKTVKAVMGNKA